MNIEEWLKNGTINQLKILFFFFSFFSWFYFECPLKIFKSAGSEYVKNLPETIRWLHFNTPQTHKILPRSTLLIWDAGDKTIPFNNLQIHFKNTYLVYILPSKELQTDYLCCYFQMHLLSKHVANKPTHRRC